MTKLAVGTDLPSGERRRKLRARREGRRVLRANRPGGAQRGSGDRRASVVDAAVSRDRSQAADAPPRRHRFCARRHRRATALARCRSRRGCDEPLCTHRPPWLTTLRPCLSPVLLASIADAPCSTKKRHWTAFGLVPMRSGSPSWAPLRLQGSDGVAAERRTARRAARVRSTKADASIDGGKLAL